MGYRSPTTVLVRERHDERKRHIESRHVGSSEMADLPADAFASDCDRFAGYHLRSCAQPRFRSARA
jgi:hypothetical protein